MSKLVEQFLKEVNFQELYFREDPDSEEAKRSIEEGDDVDVGASLTVNGNTYDFVWRRSKSNLNLTQHKFTHYLSRYAYADEKRGIEGQKSGNDIIDLKTDDGNIGLLCSVPIEVLNGVEIDDCYNKSDDFPPSVLLLVRQEKSDSNRIRLITCYPTDNSKYLKWYAKKYYSRPRKHSDNLEINDIEVEAQRRESMRLSETEEFKKSSEAFKEVIEELIDEMVDNLHKGYEIFTSLL